jgi:hypothetical protein
MGNGSGNGFMLWTQYPRGLGNGSKVWTHLRVLAKSRQAVFHASPSILPMFPCKQAKEEVYWCLCLATGAGL